MLYSIRDWDKHFELSQFRKCDKVRWVRIPFSYNEAVARHVLPLADGVELFAAWNLILQVASKCPIRGILEQKGEPLTAEDIGLITGAPDRIFERALEVLTQRQYGSFIAADGDLQQWRREHAQRQELNRQARQQACGKRRARKNAAPCDLTKAQWRSIVEEHESRCAYCGIQLNRPVLEHKTPLCRGGHHTASNVAPACTRCNSSKGQRTVEEFIAWRESRA